jgi:hypothetical protein
VLLPPYQHTNFQSLGVGHECVATFPTSTSLFVEHGFHILANTKFKHITSTYYHS